MIKYYSKADPTVLCHMVYQTPFMHDWVDDSILRTDISPESEYLQAAHIYIPKEGHRFRPHIHRPLAKETKITQESWVVLSGLIQVTFYDIDGTLLGQEMLHPGWMSITFRGGHTYESLRDDTNIIEFKTGPYFGQEKDKEFIDEENK